MRTRYDGGAMDLNQMAARVVRQTVEPDPPKPAETAAQQTAAWVA